jgi:hypothetical protein
MPLNNPKSVQNKKTNLKPKDLLSHAIIGLNNTQVKLHSSNETCRIQD